MKALDWLKGIHSVCQFQSVEASSTSDKPNKVASNSELRRWVEQGSVVVNGEKLLVNEEMDFPIHSVVLFPKSVIRRTTIW